MLGCGPEALSGDAAAGLVALVGCPEELVRDRRFAGSLGRALGADEIGASGLFNLSKSAEGGIWV